jgi:hypothetical protein
MERDMRKKGDHNKKNLELLKLYSEQEKKQEQPEKKETKK